MDPSIDDDDNNLSEPLLEDEDVNPEKSDQKVLVEGVGAIIDDIIGSGCNCYVIGQWIWLCLAWSFMMRVITRDMIFYKEVGAIVTYFAVMCGHGILFVMLPKPPGLKPSRLAEVNQETLPAILSGLRLFCLNEWVPAVMFLQVIAVAFALFELCGAVGCFTTLYKILIQEIHVFNQMEAVHYLEAQNDGPASQGNAGIDSNIPTKLKVDQGDWRRSCVVIGQWIWILLVWSVVYFLLEYKTKMAYGVVHVATWMLGMCGHGNLLAVLPRSRRESPSPSSINRVHLPIMLSACYLFAMECSADEFLVVIAKCYITCRAFQVAWRFTLTMTSKMEKEYLESLKENEADEAAELELQMERMAYLESLPRPRPDPTKRRRKVLQVIFGLVALSLWYGGTALYT